MSECSVDVVFRNDGIFSDITVVNIHTHQRVVISPLLQTSVHNKRRDQFM